MLVYVLYVITVFNYDFKHIKVPWTKFCFTLNLFEGLNFVGGFEGLFKITNEHFFHTLFNWFFKQNRHFHFFLPKQVLFPAQTQS